MKLRDNLTLLTVVVLAAGLETSLLCMYWAGKDFDAPPFNTSRFLIEGHLFVVGACALAFFASSYFLRPLESIIGGIALFGEGRFDHRIRRFRIREIDLVAEQLNGMAARLGEVDALKSEFVANVSHELRSPLAAIEEYADLLLASPALAGRDRDNLLRIQGNLERLRHMVENLLEMSRLEAGSLTAKSEPFDLSEAVDDVCALLAPRLSGRKLTLETRIDPALGPVRADRDLVKQVLTNLIDNAVKYNKDEGRITVSAKAESGRALVTVSDTGPGIAPEHMEKLFQRFRRLPAAGGNAKTKGSGLGLAISRSLARAMGGELSAQSRPGEGSAFTCTLPLERRN